MAMPPGEDGSYSLLGQILAKQGEMSVQVAVILEKMQDIPDHEQRIRALERWRWGLPVSAFAALGSVAAAVFAAMHH